MSLLGIDVGTTGCKTTAFSSEGRELATSYREYNFISEKDGYAELDSFEVWGKIRETIKEVTTLTREDPVTALSVSSMGEAMVPVKKDRQIAGNSILGNDLRGEEFVQTLLKNISPESIYQINGNIPDVFYSFPKIAWLKKYKPEVYAMTDYFLLWADFVCYMLGGIPVTSYSLANRTLLFDVHECRWDEKIIQYTGIDISKLAPPYQAGSCIGNVSDGIGNELNLNPGVAIISGGHDQCCAALGSGVTGESNIATYGMGSFICITPVYSKIPDFKLMYRNKLNFEHHVVPGLFVSFIYNLSGGALVKWFKNTFADHGSQLSNSVSSGYDILFDEIPDYLNDIIVIPRFFPTGPPGFLKKCAGTISGLSYKHSRGDIFLAILEGITYYFKDFLTDPERDFLHIDRLVANGGGSKSEKWLQVTADILNKPVIRNKVTEAGTLGAAILAGWGSNVFPSVSEGVKAMVKKDREFLPVRGNVIHYEKKFEQYKKLYSFLLS